MRSIFLASIFLLSFTITFAVGTAFAGTYHILDAAEQAMYSNGYHTATNAMGQGMNPIGRFRILTPNVPTAYMTRELVVAGGGRLAMRTLAFRAGQLIPYVGLAVTAYMTYDAFRDATNSDPQRYPNLYQITNTIPDATSSTHVGDVIHTPSGYEQVLEMYPIHATGCSGWSPGASSCGAGWWCVGVDVNSECSPNPIANTLLQIHVGPAPQPLDPALFQPATNEQIESNYNAANNPNRSAIEQETADLIRNHPNSVTTEPGATEVSNELAQQAQRENATNIGSQIDSLESARDRYQTLCTNGDQSACAKVDELEAEIKAKQRELDQNNTDPRYDPVDSGTDKTEDMPPNDTATLKEFKFDKWKDLQNVMLNIWPFSMLTSLSNTISILAQDPHAPVLSAHIYGNNSATVDLSIFDPVAAVSRWMFKFLLSMGCIWVVVNWWKGVGNS